MVFVQKPNNRERILCLLQIIESSTDDQTRLPMSKIREALAERGYPAERKALYEDFEAMKAVGYPVALQKGKGGGWHLERRPFSRPELRFLIDAVQANRSLTQKKTKGLIEKLQVLGGPYRVSEEQICLEGRTKSRNEAILDNIACIDEAFAQQRTISFQYLQRDASGKDCIRRDGKAYIASPRALLCNHEHYYLVAEDHLRAELRHYRVDKLRKVRMLTLPARPSPPDFHPAHYSKHHFSMFGGREAPIILRAPLAMADVLLDRFGETAHIEPEVNRRILLHARIAISSKFYGWIFGLGGQVELRAPYWAVNEYREKLQKSLDQHAGFEADDG